ncbi:bile acid:sodium symporter [Myxococcota bacterium]|nr:bile acid:sodium symporter [Myxococcota bacterium]
MQQIALTVLLIVTMLAIGMGTKIAEFAALRQHKGSLLFAGLLNLIAVPAFAWWFLSVLPLEQPVVLGILLCMVSPGGVAGPLLTLKAKGDAAAATVTMILLSLLSVVIAPLALVVILGAKMTLARSVGLFGSMLSTLVLYLLFPLVVGLMIQHYRPLFAARYSKPMSQAANVLLLLVVMGLLMLKFSVFLLVGWLGLGCCVLLILLNLGVGALTSTDASLRRSYSMVAGIRNIPFALLIATFYFTDPLIDASALAYSFLMMALAYLVAWFWGRFPPARKSLATA